MGRRRRSPEQARAEILDATEALLIREGPTALKLQRVAAEVGMSHPGLLHHFGSITGLSEALHERVSRRIRTDLLEALTDDPEERGTVMLNAMSALADPGKGRMLAWLIASGRDPFPDAGERGLLTLARGLANEDTDLDELRNRILLVVLAMLADSMVGSSLRRRLGLEEQDSGAFQQWLLTLVRTPSPQPNRK